MRDSIVQSVMMQSNDGVWVVYKPLLLTPLQVIQKLKNDHPELSGIKITYVGRLDPLAEGVMILLSGDAISDKKAFMGLNKTYEFDLLLGVSTDTFDLMGIPKIRKITKNLKITSVRLRQLLRDLIGTVTQAYPPFSGKTINGIKMFELAKANLLMNEKIPKQKGEIYEAKLLSEHEIPFGYLLSEVVRRVESIEGDFRQMDIIQAWKALTIPLDTRLPSYRIRVSCSSGLFVRSIAQELGEKLNLGGLSSHILRTHVGGYSLEDCIYLTENS